MRLFKFLPPLLLSLSFNGCFEPDEVGSDCLTKDDAGYQYCQEYYGSNAYFSEIENRTNQKIFLDIEEVYFKDGVIVEERKVSDRYQNIVETIEHFSTIKEDQFLYIDLYREPYYDLISGRVTITFEDGSQYKIAGWDRDYYSEDKIDKYGVAFVNEKKIEELKKLYNDDSFKESLELKLIIEEDKNITILKLTPEIL